MRYDSHYVHLHPAHLRFLRLMAQDVARSADLYNGFDDFEGFNVMQDTAFFRNTCLATCLFLLGLYYSGPLGNCQPPVALLEYRLRNN